MGAVIERRDPFGYFRGEDGATLAVAAAPAGLRGTSLGGELVVRAIDEVPILAAVAAIAEGETVIDRLLETVKEKSIDLEEAVRRGNRVLAGPRQTDVEGFVHFPPTTERGTMVFEKPGFRRYELGMPSVDTTSTVIGGCGLEVQ